MSTEQRKQQVIPASHDILCGSGGHVNGHEGNQMFRQVLRRHHSGYINATTKPQKMRITKIVLGELTLTGSRFLKKDPIFDRWYLVGDKAVRDKISHCLRKMEAPELQAGGEETTEVSTAMIQDNDQRTIEAPTITTSSTSENIAAARDSSENSINRTPCCKKDLNTAPSQAGNGLEDQRLRGHRDLTNIGMLPRPTPTVSRTQSSLVGSFFDPVDKTCMRILELRDFLRLKPCTKLLSIDLRRWTLRPASRRRCSMLPHIQMNLHPPPRTHCSQVSNQLTRSARQWVHQSAM